MCIAQVATEADAGSYTCTVSNTAGAATSQTALVTVRPRYAPIVSVLKDVKLHVVHV
jgi:hypothetical protein